MFIFTAAVSSPDLCAADYEACRKVNVDGACYFIQKALDMGCRVLFFPVMPHTVICRDMCIQSDPKPVRIRLMER